MGLAAAAAAAMGLACNVAMADEATKPPAGPTTESPFEYEALTQALFHRAQSEEALRVYILRVSCNL